MSLERVLGQEKALRRLRSLLAAGKTPSALLFHGPEGVGKLLAARELAKSLICGACDACPSCSMVDRDIHPDVRVLDARYQAGLRDKETDRDPERQREWLVASARALCREMERRSMMGAGAGAWKAAIVDDAHRMTPEAQNALLKMLEEPPERTLWILVTDKRERLLPTILSRTQPLFFRPLEEGLVSELLKRSGVPTGEAEELAALSEGSVRGALELREISQALRGLDWKDPLAPYRLCEFLPKDLMAARRKVRLILEHHLRRLRPGLARGPAAAGLLRELLRCRQLLDLNVSPAILLETASLRAQEALRQAP